MFAGIVVHRTSGLSPGLIALAVLLPLAVFILLVIGICYYRKKWSKARDPPGPKVVYGVNKAGLDVNDLPPTTEFDNPNYAANLRRISQQVPPKDSKKIYEEI